MTDTWTLTLPHGLHTRLWDHLFPGDDDEHGAVILAGITTGPDGVRLLGRELLLAEDGRDYVPGTRGYRALTAQFVQRAAIQARDRGLAYLAVHCHSGDDHVSFSRPDLASHERGYPALRDITRQPVGGLVAARQALAGDLWLPNGDRAALAATTVPGNHIRRLYPAPPPAPPTAGPGWDRQLRLLGDRGQHLLEQTTVAIVGLGGVGSILAEYLGRLGVGGFVLIDPDHIEPDNLNRMIAAMRGDAGNRRSLGRLLRRGTTAKVRAAARNIRRANPNARSVEHATDVADAAAARALTSCDYVFLAADTHTARHVVNAIVQQYLIPGVQAGVKIRVNDAGDVDDVHVAVRPLTPGQACLWCAELIDPSELAIEALPSKERRVARYVPDVPAPSVITLNGIAAAEAATHFLFALTGLSDAAAPPGALLRFPRGSRLYAQAVTQSPTCRWCTETTDSQLGRGDTVALPVLSAAGRAA